MLPIPTERALFAFLGSVAALAIALIAQSPSATVLAGGMLLGLSAALALTMSIGARLRRERIEFAWWFGHAERGEHSAGALTDVPFDVHCYVRNHGARALALTELLPIMPAGVRVLGDAPSQLVLPARSQVDFSLRLSASAASRVVLQGLAVVMPGPFGFFSAPLYFASPLTIKVLPRTAARGQASSRFVGGEAVERSGVTPMRRRGSGLELHEIREHLPGDSFKSIAWKASARAGKLLVREVEREVQDTLQIVLDVSGSMRGGAAGERRLDHAIELCAHIAQDALQRGDRAGLCAVDGRVVARVEAAEGVRHMLRIYDALLGVTEIVDADLTAIDDADVTAKVGQYLRQQEGRNYALQDGWDLVKLAWHAAQVLTRAGDRQPAVASTPEHALLRRFCRVRGLALPYRSETRGFGKAAGIAQALKQAAGTARTPRTLIAVCDFDGSFDMPQLLETLRFLRARQHQVCFIVPDSDALIPPAENDCERDLRRIYALQEARRIADVRLALTKLGVRVVRYGGRDSIGAALRQTTSLRHVA